MLSGWVQVDKMLKCTLLLQDGSSFEGTHFGAPTSMAGEIVFQTGMVGYPESLTDPSYHKQLLVLTYPLIGNYGVPSDEMEDGLLKYFESSNIHASGLVIGTLSKEHNHWNAHKSLEVWMKSQNVPGIHGVDTRALTKKIRDEGSMLAKIVFGSAEDDPNPGQWFDPNTLNLVKMVSCKKAQVFNEMGKPHIAMLDCGMKFNQVRNFLKLGAKVTVLPWDSPLDASKFDGFFLSNGPGNPEMIRTILNEVGKLLEGTKPVFGICLGNQVLALAAGCKTFKMKFGNRGHNQPATHIDSKRCMMTSQNHGYAVDKDSLPGGWLNLFINQNDGTNEGLVHESKPFFSVQFHPEHCAGPEDSNFLFKVFLDHVCEQGSTMSIRERLNSVMMKNIPTTPGCVKASKVLVLGSGGLSIGQAGEFDYSGSQALKALKEEGIETVLINPNVATVQTSVGMADKTYFLPITPSYVEQVIQFERPDGILLAFGGQTALNCGIKLRDQGVLRDYNVEVLGTPVKSIEWTEDRAVFAEKMAEIGEKVAPSRVAYTIDEAVAAAAQLGYPVLVRTAYALGGLGSGFADDVAQLKTLVTSSLASQAGGGVQVLIDKSLRGWKEIEYEVVRDCVDNCVTVCNMENFDPLGIHTGESIVIAPSQTLSDKEYNMLRSTALKVIRHLGIVGECNIQYALDPHSLQYFIVEVNARLSRSSALASKATGYPLAYIAAKLALHKTLPELRNSVTLQTTACFEPSLDYVVVKIPRWDLKKFTKVTQVLGSSMKSVGEVMAIGRRFEEALQKAVRMAEADWSGVDPDHFGRVPTRQDLSNATSDRVQRLAAALASGISTQVLNEWTGIDVWFLTALKTIVTTHATMKSRSADHQIERDLMLSAKKLGFSDLQIAKCLGITENAVRSQRLALAIRPWVKQIDTVAAEWPATTNYLYLTYNGCAHDVDFTADHTMVLGSGVYRIGSSVEFDWCAVSCVETLKTLGKKTIMVNYNPETVSTDYDMCDKLYFDELSLETVLAIYELEQPLGVIVAMGGQQPNNIALRLHHQGVRIMGTSPESIDSAENRFKFSRLLDSVGISQPRWKELVDTTSAIDFADRVGYPVLVRPSYVLSGAAMSVAGCAEDLTRCLRNASDVSKEHPVVVSKFVQEAKELDVDAVAAHGELVAMAICEHIENAGVHSGDASLVTPPQDLNEQTIERISDITRLVASELNITGPFNMQLIAKDNQLKVIECNVRVSRSFPFVSKTLGCNLIDLATRVIVGVAVEPVDILRGQGGRVGVKVPVFSFARLTGADTLLGVEMASTGEVACFGADRYEAYLKSILSSGFTLPDKKILLSIGSYKAKVELLESVRVLQTMGFILFGSLGTADFYSAHDIRIQPIDWPLESRDEPRARSNSLPRTVSELLESNMIDLVINLPHRTCGSGNKASQVQTQGYKTRRMAIDYSVPLITDVKIAKMFIRALHAFDGKAPAASPLTDCLTAHRIVKLPGLIDVHVHVRQPGDEHKETWTSCTAAALAGGITTILAMPNTKPALTDEASLRTVKSLAARYSVCDYGLYAGASLDNVESALSDELFRKCVGLKMYLNDTFTTLRMDDMAVWMRHFERWPGDVPLVCHAEGAKTAAVILMSHLFKRPVHICHVATKEEIEVIVASKRRGLSVTCEVAPHHLFLTLESAKSQLGESGLCEVRPRLGTQSDVDALWENWHFIDCIATDHAPHLVSEKTAERAVPGFPGLQTCLPLLLNAVAQGRCSLDDIAAKMHHNPIKIFNLPPSDLNETFIEVDLDETVVVCAAQGFSKAGWSPFEGWALRGVVKRVTLRGAIVFVDGRVLADAGTGQDVVSLRRAVKPVPRVSLHEEPPSTHPPSFAHPPSFLLSPVRGRHESASPQCGGPVTRVLKPGGSPLPIKAPASNVFHGKHVISTGAFTKNDLRVLFKLALFYKSCVSEVCGVLKGKAVALMFLEPSTRTQCSFSAAIQRLGGVVIDFNTAASSLKKGESLMDTVHVMSSYADAIVIRHSEEGALHTLTASSSHFNLKPIISGGDGAGEHPTQALLDVFTIREEIGTVNGLTITLCGDLKNGRTTHSLAKLLALYSVHLRYVAIPGLEMPQHVIDYVTKTSKGGVKQSFASSLEDGVLEDTDVLYMTRVQTERLGSSSHAHHTALTPTLMNKAKTKMIVLHPLPRNQEIDPTVDSDPRAAYFRQAENGVYVRMALLSLVLGVMPSAHK